MHGRELEGGEIRKRSRHMWSTTTVAAVHSNGSSDNHFVKDGRKINVGDCALFKPAQECPPFIGLIRAFTSDKENNLRLKVNWLYRPAEVILGKGVALEAAPNEVFYSFHTDEIPAASLLHPCKVAFLPKGLELPPAISSFVCRRVYDITNKCLWWLTDQDYIDDHQEELDQLLNKTRVDMQTAQQQQGARSPKSVNGSAAMSPLKSSPESVQNSSSNLPSQTKGRKRERGVQSSDPVKRERSVKTDGGDSTQFRSESMLKLEIAKLAEKGGLVDSEAVERLVQLMQPEKSEQRIDLSGRCLLVGIIAATDKDACLSQFVEKGLPVLDEWLQEVHKGKIGDPGNIKDGDKSVEDFILVLLRALDKLPVNLNALQMCNIGKSVNHLRWHKNSEIQKKARSLVDTWKKRVEAEISIKDAKSGSSQAVQWAAKSRHEGSHGGNKHSNGSSDAAVRSSVTHHSSLKSTSVKLPGDSALKSAGGVRSASSPTSASGNFRDGQLKVCTNGASSEQPLAAVKDERSSSSSPSHTNSQCSIEHAKSVIPLGEDAKSSAVASKRLNKLTGSGSKHRKSANGFQGTAISGLQREAAPSRSTSMAKVSVAEKASQNANANDVHEGYNHKLIVKIPNRGRGPAQSVAGGSAEDISCGSSRASSPAPSEKHDQSDASLRGKHDTHQSNEADGSATVQHRSTSDPREMPNVTKAAYLPSKNEMEAKKALDPAFSSMNALVESCVQFAESNESMSAGDDAGMNLLASVAAGEISTSGTASPSILACRDSTAVENSSNSYSGDKKQVPVDESVLLQYKMSTDIPDAEKENVAGLSKADGVESNSQSGHDSAHRDEEIYLKSRSEPDEQVGVASLGTSKKSASDACTPIRGGRDPTIKDESHSDPPGANQSSSLAGKDGVKDGCLTEESGKAVGDAVLNQSSSVDEKGSVTPQLQSSISMELKSIVKASKSEAADTAKKPTMVSPSKPSFNTQISVVDNDVKLEKADRLSVGEHGGQEGRGKLGQENGPAISQKQEESELCFTDKDQESNCADKKVDDKEACVQKSSNFAIQGTPCEVASQEAAVNLSSNGSNLAAVEDGKKGDSASATENAGLSPAAGGLDIAVKLGFDLNEGLSVEDGKSGEPVYSGTGPGPCVDTVCSISPIQMPVSSSNCSLSAAITVASAAKGPFVPPEDLLKNKREVGWKGSAATSAFRPAEPRKVTEAPLGSSNSPVPDAPPCKRARVPLDIDLNVADEGALLELAGPGSGEEPNLKNELVTSASLRSSGGIDLDLNKVDDAADLGHSSQRVEVPTPPIKASTSSMFMNGETSGRRDFDLNNGPGTDDMHAEQTLYTQNARGNIVFQPPFAPRINGPAPGNYFAWYPPGTNYAVSMPPSSLPEKEALPVTGMGSGVQLVMGGPTSTLSFNPDDYKGSVLSSTPAMPFQSTPFQYSVLPFGASFRLPTPTLSGGPSGYMDLAAAGRMPAMPSPAVGSSGAVSFQYPQPYVVSRPISDVANNGIIEGTQKWGKQGLDLNSGPGGVDMERRDGSQPVATRQLSAAGSSQSLTEEQARMYNMVGGVMKRKEPEAGWSIDTLNFRPSSSWR